MKGEPRFRPITPAEKRLVLKLLEVDFPGNSELRLQLSGVLAKRIEEDGTLLFEVRSDVLAPVRRRVPVEAWYSDVNSKPLVGPFVRILLHVVAGKLSELEIYKDDGSPIIKKPELAELTFFSPDSPNR
jgi:hypothetical protein